MAGTTIKSVGNGGSVQMPDLVSAAKQSAGTGFQAVWNKTQNSAQTTNSTAGDRTQTGRSDVRRGDSLRNSGRQREDVVNTSNAKDTVTDDSTVDTKDMEKIQEVLGTVVQNLMQQITETFSVSEEEVQGVMEELGMTETDLTDPGQLNELLMAVSGAQDSFALLTDENLYSGVKGIMDLQKDLVGQAQEELQLTPEQWQETIPQITQETETETVPEITPETAVKAVTEPVITVEVEADDDTVRMDRQEEPVVPTETVAAQETEDEAKIPVQNTQEEKTGDKQEHTSGGQHGNLLLQNLKEDNFLTQLQQTAQAEEPQTADTQDIMRQIMDYMKVSVKADSSDLEMQLHPQSLGTLHVQIASKNGVVTANFITQNETVKAALESQMVQLKENFAEQGVKVEAIEVTVQTHQFEQNLEQGRGHNSNQENEAGVGRKRTRRINLNAPLMEEETQTEEDRIAADLMSANGNTVDFTA